MVAKNINIRLCNSKVENDSTYFQFSISEIGVHRIVLNDFI